MNDDGHDGQRTMETDVSKISSDVEGEALAGRRTERVFDYLRSALGQADPLRANVGAVNADLMLVADRLRQLLDEAALDSLEDFEELKPVIDSLLRVHKQIDRFAQLDARLGAPPTKSVESARKALRAIAGSEEVEN